jgi:hypothetical protein
MSGFKGLTFSPKTGPVFGGGDNAGINIVKRRKTDRVCNIEEIAYRWNPPILG